MRLTMAFAPRRRETRARGEVEGPRSVLVVDAASDGGTRPELVAA